MIVATRLHHWVLCSGAASYGIGIAPEGVLVHTYWGRPLAQPGDYPTARLGHGSSFEHPLQNTALEIVTGEAGAMGERTLDATTPDGQLRGLALRFESAELDDNRLDITLVDAALGLRVTVHYQTLDQSGLFSRSVSIASQASTPVTLTRAFSASFHLPDHGKFALNHLDGRWSDEFRRHRDPLPFGVTQRESRRLTTSHGGVPYFAIDRDAPGHAAGEEHGALWFGTLEWSGNWKLLAERTTDDRTSVHLGLNDHDFAIALSPGDSFTTPRIVFGYTEGGFGAMSRALHHLVRTGLSPRPGYQPPVVYNSWYATAFDVDEAGQTLLADKAAAMGVELFVIDDGWFSGRAKDNAGLGDWWPDAIKFPNGLAPLANAVKARGMGFGLWIEPEMVNPDSALYRTHPDWIIHFEGRDRTLMRGQSILNLGRTDVQDYLIAIFDTLLTKTPIDFIKWDMNRNVSEPGWPGHPGDPREVWVRYVEGLYRVWRTLRQRHPGIIWENCSGGGGRVDLAMMGLTEQSWTSDNTLPPARLAIQHGYSLLFPASTMAAWVTDEDKAAYGLDFRFHASMAGALGIGGNLLAWTDAEQATAASHIARYKTLRPLIAQGDLYRLVNGDNALWAFAYVASDKSAAVLFAFRTHRAGVGRNAPIPIHGLDPAALYAIEGTPEIRSGSAWAALGLSLPLHDFESVVLSITRLPPAVPAS